MTGRDPHEEHRAATPLELIYDLTIVAAFSTAGAQFAHLIGEGRVLAGVCGFAIAVFAVSWPWINFSWFNSAFDTDDWYVRGAVLLQMIGVVVATLGLADLFAGISEWEVHAAIVVAGYVVMRCGILLLWMRSAREHPQLRGTCLRYARGIALTQVVWVAFALLDLPGPVALPCMAALFVVEMAIPARAETGHAPTPWHPGHIAERYSLLVIISLGEVIVGTVGAVEALIDEQGWSVDAVVVMAAGISLAFALWWTYFGLPFEDGLRRVHPRPALVFGYGHMLVFGAIAAVGAGLHVAAFYIGDQLRVGPIAVVVSIAVPTVLALALFLAIYQVYLGERRGFHYALLAVATGLAVLAVVLAIIGAPVSACIAVVMLAPWAAVIGYETVGHRHIHDDLTRG